MLACVLPELQASYTRNTYNNVLKCITGPIQGVHKLENFACFFPGMPLRIQTVFGHPASFR